MCKKVILVVTIILFSVLILSYNKSEAKDSNKRYSVDIEWGSFSFVYDKGSWDTESLEYVKQETSKYPAKGTEEGKPRMVSI